MNVVERVIEKVGGQTELAARLTDLTGHSYQQGHVSYWKRVGYFPSDIARVVSETIMQGEISEHEACPKIKRTAAA